MTAFITIILSLLLFSASFISILNTAGYELQFNVINVLTISCCVLGSMFFLIISIVTALKIFKDHIMHEISIHAHNIDMNKDDVDT